MRNLLYISILALSFILVSAGPAAPAEITVTPSEGPVDGGNEVIISGLPEPGDVEGVLFGDYYVTDWYLYPCHTMLTVVVPSHPAGTVDITILSEPQILIEDAYTYLGEQPQEDLTVTPSTGSVGGGNVVIISGFSYLSALVDVQFDENPATNVHPSDDGTRLSMIAPAHPAGTVDITVWYPGLETSYIIENAYTYSSDLPSVGTAVIQATGGSYITDTLSVTIPPGAVSDTVYFQYSHIQTPDNPAPTGMGFGGNSFSLDVYADGSSLSDYDFNNPVTTTVTFDEGTVVSNTLDVSTLALFYWSGSQGAWANDGITTVGRDTENNVVTSTITHLTDFAVIGSALDDDQDSDDGDGDDSQDDGDGGDGGSTDGGGTCFVSTLL